MPRKYTRDPHLPSAEICDWLLSLEWEGPSEAEMRTSTFTGTRFSAMYASAALGRDHIVELFVDSDAHAALQDDARAATAWFSEHTCA